MAPKDNYLLELKRGPLEWANNLNINWSIYYQQIHVSVLFLFHHRENVNLCCFPS